MPAPQTDPFSPAEWRPYFASLDPQVRSRCATELCAAVVQQTGLQSPVVEQALASIAEGRRDADALTSVESLLAEIEEPYEQRGGCDAPVDDDAAQTAFVQARAVSAVMFALREEWVDMAYEAVHAVPCDQDPLDCVRRIAD